MGSFGERLRREREMRGITLEEIAEATKIGSRSLRALEQEQFEKLPGGIFNKGFVRAYARFLGIDEEQAVADYLSVCGEPQEPLAAMFAAGSESGGETDLGGEASERAPLPWRRLVTIAAVVLLAAIGWVGYQRWKGQQEASEPAISSTEVPVPPSSAAPPQAVATTVTSDTALAQTPAVGPIAANISSAPPQPKPTKPAGQPQSVAPPSAPIMLRIRAHADAWLQITADDKIVMSAILPAASERIIRADKRVVLDIGNAGGVEITHNGKPVAPFGPEGKRKVVTFTPEGVQP